MRRGNGWGGIGVALIFLVLAIIIWVVIDQGPQSTVVSAAEPATEEGIVLDWHSVNPPRPGLTCWAAEVWDSPAAYGGVGYSYTYCEPSD